jgi:single-strand DNA-binding protein
MLNKVMLIGRLGRDPELRYTQAGAPVASLRLATDESYTDKDGNRVELTEWHSVSVFQRAAENCANYLAKGSLVFVEGSLQTRKWQDQQGQDRYTTNVKASRVQFLDRRGEAGGRQAPAEEGEAPRKSKRKQQDDDLGPAFPSEAGGMDDMPF